MENSNILLVNPSIYALRLAKEGLKTEKGAYATFTIVNTAKSSVSVSIDLNNVTKVFDKNNVEVADLKSIDWNFDVKFVSGFAFDYAGQVLLESIAENQIVLRNGGDPTARLNSYLRSPTETNDILVETLSYLGRHVVIAAWRFLENKKLEIITDFTNEWIDLVETTFENLDNLKLSNGPAQTYIRNSVVFGTKYNPSNIRYVQQKEGTERHWFDIWPMTTLVHTSNPISASRKFYEWTDNTGTAKTYKATTLTI